MLAAARPSTSRSSPSTARSTRSACKDYLTFIGSDFVEQGKRAADQMVKATGGKGKVAILLGASGNNVTTDRTKGFKDEIGQGAPGIKIVFEQTGDFAREKGQAVTEQLSSRNPDINGIYAENDEMGLGAVTALKGAGKKAGDVKIVSVDGTRTPSSSSSTAGSTRSIESNPRFGPLAFETAAGLRRGDADPGQHHHLRRPVRREQRRAEGRQRVLTNRYRADEACRNGAWTCNSRNRCWSSSTGSNSSWARAPSPASRSPCAPARSTRWSARTAPASPR